MPTALVQTYSRNKLIPLYEAQRAQRVSVALKASATYAAGQVLGEVTASPGTYGIYASGNADGTQNPAVLLEYACTTDASGNITMDGEFGATYNSAPAFLPVRLAWSSADLVGLDANALTKLGGVQAEGTLTAGTVII